ncbi:BamA/TamA family outer membrane protein [Leptolyngbya sp. FACHB-36]|uniref:BamA/TamA family outer membrane protein n=1 Tax=Leptolyngbya sp. FACHB-36 TaxID=2692808 RepID=UPI001680A17E|nr:BamA/TamA family outer membrane protein [Leptolyngbya sp. FACHB-36]MBD2022165.1 BamA/TamA family outer membrane protein [Leptolyngbya sp. FACHB-36]
MRLSPVLAAFLATATTLSLSNSAKGQVTAAAERQPAATAANSAMSNPRAAVKPAAPEVFGNASSIGILTAPARLSQAQPSTQPTPLPPTGTEATPQQETPDRIQIGPAPQQAPGIPTPSTPAPTPTPSPAPADPTTPAPTPAEPTAPTPTPPTTPPTAPPATPAPTAEPEARVLVAEVAIREAKGATLDATVLDEVYRVLRTQAGRTTTRSQLQEDINAVFGTGFFSNVRAVPEDTPLGVRVTFEVELNPVLQSVRVEGTQVLPQQVVDESFRDQYGTVLNLNRLQEGIKRVNKWYQDNGYVLAQVVGSPRIAPDGIVTLEIAEGVVENVQVRFTNKEGADTDPKTGQPIRGRTREFIITREFELKSGSVFNRNIAERDLQRVFGLGIFEDVRLSLNPGQDPRRVVVVANVTERNTGSIAAGAGISSASGLFGTLSYQQQNFGGNNQKLGAEIQIGQRDSLLFDLSFTDPWIANDPYRTSYTLNLFRRRTISLIFDGGDPEVRLPNGDRPRVTRTGGGISFSRPLSRDVFRRSQWTASLGLQYQRISIRDSEGDLSPRDELGNTLSFSGDGRDDLFTVQFGAVRDLRNDPLRPTQGSLLRIGTEQSIPIGRGNILLNRLRGSYSFYIPTRLLRISPGCRSVTSTAAECPQAFAFNIQGGTVLGDLPPYEAFSLGGSNSVRGYDEGDLASARSFIQATAEYRFPIFSVVSGALFVDAATDFGSSDNVPGNPGGVRNKPGAGIGYGLGLRIQSPLGPIRIDYGLNDEGDSRFHFGIGERF